MNFFGHAAVARLVDDDPAFVLGAMAPDLLGMCGLVAGTVTSPRLAAGQAHHLTVDAAFHGSATFVALQSWAVRALVTSGLRRGPARGAAHVGVELLLDGVLAGDRRARDAYQRSLASAQSTPEPFLWPDESTRARWLRLISRLRAGGIPDRYRDPDFVTDRLVGALNGRPRLALTDPEVACLRGWIPALQQRVAAEADDLIPRGGVIPWR